jgi:hypothetical protein
MRDTLTSGAEQILLVVLVGHHTYEQPTVSCIIEIIALTNIIVY